MDIISKNADLAVLAARILNGIASDEDMASVDRAEVYAIKGDTSSIHVRGVAAPVSSHGNNSRTRRFIASDESRDRMGDIIRVAGWRFDEFAKNPVALWGHDSDSYPIGTVSDWKADKMDGRPVLRESITYFSEAANPASEAILRMIDEGGLRAVSVGFAPIKVTTPRDDDQRKEMGLGPYGVLYEAQMQLELSNCSIPANPNAILSKSTSPVVDALDDLVKSGKLKRDIADDLLLRAALIAPRKRTFALGAVEKLEQEELDEVYGKWRDAVNMSATELKAWNENPCSRKASVDAAAVIERNLELLETPKDKWDRRLVDNANRTISFVARMLGAEQGEPVNQECKISKRDISLKNWAHDPSKGKSMKASPLSECVSEKIPKIRDEHPEWEMDQVIAVAYQMCGEKGCRVVITRAAPGELKVGDMVEWDSSGGKAVGKVEEIKTEGTLAVPGTDFTLNATEEDPAVLLCIYKMVDGEWQETEQKVGHRMSELRPMKMAGEYEKPEEEEEEGDGVEIEIEMSDEEKSMRSALTALDARLASVQDSIEALHKRLDGRDIEVARARIDEQATAALRSSETEIAAAMLGAAVGRVARKLGS